MKRLIEYDPETRTSVWHEYDHLTKVTTIHEQQDAEPHIELGKSLQNDDNYKRQGIKKGWMHLAHIPNSVLLQWSRESGISNIFSREGINYCARKVHERDWSYLKTARGKFIRAG